MNHCSNSRTINPPQTSIIRARQWVVNLPDVPLFSTGSSSQTYESLDVYQSIGGFYYDANDSNLQDPMVMSFQPQEPTLSLSITSQPPRPIPRNPESITSIDDDIIGVPLSVLSDEFSTNLEIK